MSKLYISKETKADGKTWFYIMYQDNIRTSCLSAERTEKDANNYFDATVDRLKKPDAISSEIIREVEI